MSLNNHIPHENQVQPFVEKGKGIRKGLHEKVDVLIEMAESVKGEMALTAPSSETDVRGAQERLECLRDIRARLTLVQEQIADEMDTTKFTDMVSANLKDIYAFLDKKIDASEFNQVFFMSLKQVIKNEEEDIQMGLYAAHDLPNKVDVFYIEKRMRKAESVVKSRLGKVSSQVVGNIEALLEKSQELTSEKEAVIQEGRAGLEIYLALSKKHVKLQNLLVNRQHVLLDDAKETLDLVEIKRELLATEKYIKQISEIENRCTLEMRDINPEKKDAAVATVSILRTKKDDLDVVDSDAEQEAMTILKDRIKEILDSREETAVDQDQLRLLIESIEDIEDEQEDLTGYLLVLADMVDSLDKALQQFTVASENTPREPLEKDLTDTDDTSESITITPEVLMAYMNLENWSVIITLLNNVKKLELNVAEVNVTAQKFGMDDFNHRLLAIMRGQDDDSGDDTPGGEGGDGGEGEIAPSDDEAPASDDEAPASDDEAPASDEEAPASDDEAPAADDEAPAADATPAEDTDEEDEDEDEDEDEKKKEDKK